MSRARSRDKLDSCDEVCSVWLELASVSRAACDTLTTATLTCSTAVA